MKLRMLAITGLMAGAAALGVLSQSATAFASPSHARAQSCQTVLWSAGSNNQTGKFCGGLRAPTAGNEWNLVLDGQNKFIIHPWTKVFAFQFTPAATTAHVSAISPRPDARGAPVPGMTAVQRRTSTFDQQDKWFGDCQRDPSNGGLGTIVQNSSCGTSNAMDWSYQGNGTCGGTVTATCPGGPISASTALRGDFIITIRNIGQGSLCEGADAQTNWTMKMFTCDGVGGVHHYNNLFIWAQSASCGTVSGNDLISYQWNQNGNTDTASVYNPGGTGSNVQVAPVPPHCAEALWNLNGS